MLKLESDETIKSKIIYVLERPCISYKNTLLSSKTELGVINFYKECIISDEKYLIKKEK